MIMENPFLKRIGGHLDRMRQVTAKNTLQASTAELNPARSASPLFANARPRSIHEPTPIEAAGLAHAREEIRSALESIAQDPHFVAEALDRARATVGVLPKEDSFNAAQFEQYGQQLSEFLATSDASGEARRVMVEECVAAIASGAGLDSLPQNPAARFLSSQGALTKEVLRAEMTLEARDEITKPNPHAYTARAALVFGVAAGSLLLEVGTTKTALIQLIDIYDPPGIKQLVSLIASQLESFGYDKISSISAARLGIASTIAGGVGGTLLATKGLKKLGPKGRAAMYTSLGASLGLGYLALQNFVADNAAVAEMGKVISSEYKPIAEQGLSAKEKRLAAIEKAKQAVLATLEQEKNRPGATGYGHFAAFIDQGLSGKYDVGSFKSGAPQKHLALQNALRELRVKYYGSDTLGKGLLALLADVENIDLTSAPESAKALAAIGEAAGQTNLWSGLGKVLNPVGSVTTPTAMHQQASSVTESFRAMLKADQEHMNRVAAGVSDWLDTMIKAAGTQGADAKLIASLRDLKATLTANLQPLNANEETLTKALGKLPKPTGKWVVRVGDTEFAQMQKTLEGTFFHTVLGFDLVKDDSYRAYYRGGMIGLLLLFFLTINYGSKLGTNALYKRRENAFEGSLKEGGDELNEKESSLASGIARFLFEANKEFVTASKSPELATILPESVVAVYVRRRLREMFLEEQQTETPDALVSKNDTWSWLVHGIVFTRTPDDVRTFRAYDAWLEKLTKELDTSKSGEKLQDIVGTIFPSFDAVVRARHEAQKPAANKPEKMRAFKNELRKLRKQQLESIYIALSDRVKVIESTETATPEESLQGTPRLRLDIDNTRTIVEPELVMRALSRSQHSRELDEISETLRYIESLGIKPDTNKGEDLRIGRFDLGPVYAVRDELRRIRAASALGIPDATGQKEDFERFDAYMAEIAASLREARDTSLNQEPLLAPYTPVFDWEEGATGKFTVRISIHPDSERIADPVASITFPGIIPDFEKPDPTVASEKLREWLKPGSDAVRGLVAQERNTHNKNEISSRLTALRKKNNGSPSIQVVESSKPIALEDEAVTIHQELVVLQEIAREQESSIPLARRGLPIPEDKYRAFTNPNEYTSNARTLAQLPERFKDLQSRDWPDRTTITYSPNLRSFEVYITKQGRFTSASSDGFKSALSLTYTAKDIEELLSKYASLQEK